MAYIPSRNQFCFLQVESADATIPNSGGTASVANANACRIINLQTGPETGMIDRPDKTGTLSRTVGVLGRKAANVNVSMSIAGSGTAGTAPDMGPLLQSLFGKAPAIVPATSVVYAPDDTNFSLSVWNFRDPSTATQMVALGTLINAGRFNFGQEQATVEFSGVAKWVLDSGSFATTDLTGKGGLTSFPSRPSAPVTNGNMALPLFGSATLDGQAYTTLRSLAIAIDASRGRESGTLFNGAYAGPPEAGMRTVTCEFELTDDDSANLTALKNKALAKTAVNLTFVLGATAGNIWTFLLKNVLLSAPSYDDSGINYGVRFTGQAHATSATSKDEVTLTLT